MCACVCCVCYTACRHFRLLLPPSHLHVGCVEEHQSSAGRRCRLQATQPCVEKRVCSACERTHTHARHDAHDTTHSKLAPHTAHTAHTAHRTHHTQIHHTQTREQVRLWRPALRGGAALQGRCNAPPSSLHQRVCRGTDRSTARLNTTWSHAHDRCSVRQAGTCVARAWWVKCGPGCHGGCCGTTLPDVACAPWRARARGTTACVAARSRLRTAPLARPPSLQASISATVCATLVLRLCLFAKAAEAKGQARTEGALSATAQLLNTMRWRRPDSRVCAGLLNRVAGTCAVECAASQASSILPQGGECGTTVPVILKSSIEKIIKVI